MRSKVMVLTCGIATGLLIAYHCPPLKCQCDKIMSTLKNGFFKVKDTTQSLVRSSKEKISDVKDTAIDSIDSKIDDIIDDIDDFDPTSIKAKPRKFLDSLRKKIVSLKS